MSENALPSGSDENPAVLAAVIDYLEAQDRGTPVNPDTWLAQFDDSIRDEIREVLAGLDLLGRVTPTPKKERHLLESMRLAQGDELYWIWNQLNDCDADPELKQIADKCLAKLPEDGFAHAGHLADAFKDYQQGVRDHVNQAQRQLVRSESRRKWQLLAGTLLIAALIAGFVARRSMENASHAQRDANNVQGRSFLARYADICIEAERLRNSGELSQLLAVWKQAQAALEQVDGLANSSVSDEKIRVDLQQAGRQIAVSLDKTSRQQALMAKLQIASATAGARIDGFETDDSVAISSFREAFHEYGIVPEERAAENCKPLIEELPASLRDDVLCALDHWSLISPAAAHHIHPLLTKLDKNPWREEMRDAIRSADSKRLRQLASHADEQPPPPATCLRILAIALMRIERAEVSVDMLRRSILIYPRDFCLHIELAQCLERQFPKRSDEIIAAYQNVVALRGDNGITWMRLGGSLAEAGRDEEADMCFQQAARLAPENPLIRLSRAAFEIVRPESRDLQSLRELHKEYPHRTDIAAILARNLATRSGGLNEAKSLLVQAETMDKNCSQIPYTQAMVSLADQRYPDYLTIIQKLRRVDPGSQNLIRSECVGLICVGNFEDAEMLARKCLEGGNVPAAFLAISRDLLANSLTLQGRPAEAELWARQAIGNCSAPRMKLDGKQKPVLFQALLQQGKFEEALSLRPSESERNHSIDSMISGASDQIEEPVLRNAIRIKDLIQEGDVSKLSPTEMVLAPDIALACGLPRSAFPLYLRLLDLENGSSPQPMIGDSPSPLWTNEFSQLSIRLNATRAAVRAAIDPPKEPIRLTPESRKQAREQGLAWLRIEVEKLSKAATQPKQKSMVNGILCFLQRSPDFSDVRDNPGLEKLPDEERKAWEALWDQVEIVRDTVHFRSALESRSDVEESE